MNSITSLALEAYKLANTARISYCDAVELLGNPMGITHKLEIIKEVENIVLFGIYNQIESIKEVKSSHLTLVK